MAEEETIEIAEGDIPENFAGQIATDVMQIFQKQIDPDAAAAEASDYIWRNTGTTERVNYFVDATEMWLESQSTGDKFAALSWCGLLTQSVNNKNYDDYLHMMMDSILGGYYGLEKPDIDYREKKYSSYTSIISNTFIRMVELNKSFEENAAEIYSILVSKEMDLEADSQAEEEETGSSSIPTDMQKLYDEIIDYLAERAVFKASPMASDEVNPNEHVGILCERLRSSRRYIMQEVIVKRAHNKKKEIEMELENQLASAEEITMVAQQFTDGMAFFVHEKQYNIKYLAVEKIRMTLQLLGSIIGAVYFLLGFMEYWGINWIDGIMVCVIMLIFVRIVASRKQFNFFYPTDVSKELEECSSAFINVMRNMSQEQLEHFLLRQIKLESNQKYLSMIPEFIKYLYAIMPDRKSMMISVDELSELMENSEIEVAKQLRGQ